MLKQNEYNPKTVLHPYITLSEKLEELEIGPKEFALRTDKPEKTISALLKGESSITPDMAVQFENVLGIPATFWLNKQRAYDEYIAREKNKKIIKSAIPWACKFPLTDMIKKEWLPTAKSIEEKTYSILNFFGFSNHKAWKEYYCNQQLKVAFRISLAHTKEPYAISAWLRKGEMQASELNAGVYSENKFKRSLPVIKEIMAKQPSSFFKDLQEVCLKAGVKVVHTPCLPKAPINGATRWLNDTPMIQLSGRYKRNDIFWFTFFHEAGHILLHGKKDIFLENIKYTKLDKQKEEEANKFAANWTLTDNQFQEIVNADPLTVDLVKDFAKKFTTHPAIIIGRLQHEEAISYSVGRELIEPIELS